MPKKYTIEKSEGCCLPDEAQKLLIKVALGADDDAIGSYRQWRELAVFEDLDSGSYRLLPLLYSSLKDTAVDDDLFNKIKGVYRLHWAKNTLLFNAATPLLRQLHENHIPTMVLKGAVLAQCHYSHIGLRPMDDVDIMVRPEHALKTQDLLLAAGWSPVYPRTHFQPGIDKNYMRVNNSFGFCDKQNMQIDLHWDILPDCLGKNLTEAVWQRATSLNFYGVETLKLDATDQFFQILAHGIKWNNIPSFRWIVDALSILKNKDEPINWTRLFEMAKDHELLLLTREACEYLVSEYGARIPLETVAKEFLAPPTRSQVEELSARLKSRPGLFGKVSTLWNKHKGLRGKKSSLVGHLLSWPEFVKNLWGARTYWELPLVGIYKISLWKHK